jgi:hypothetical protein
MMQDFACRDFLKRILLNSDIYLMLHKHYPNFSTHMLPEMLKAAAYFEEREKLTVEAMKDGQ